MSVKKAAKAVARRDLSKRPKTNRTLSLDFEVYEDFLVVCREKGLKASNVVDELIKEYLEVVGK